jgi:hypothetical protein
LAQEADRRPPVEPESAHDTKLITGCLVAGPDQATFKLTNAAVIPPATATPSGAAGTPAAGAAAQAETEYELKAEKRLDRASVAPLDMKPFVGHKVEITARPAAAAAPTHEPPRADGEPKRHVETASSPEKKVEQLTVTAIKQVVGTCQ